MEKILVWESHSMVSGGQKMTLLISDMLKDKAEFVYLVPEEGALTHELNNRGIRYFLIGNQSMPAGVKGKKVLFTYGVMSIRAVSKAISIIRKEKPDILYAPGPAALPWSAICGSLTNKPVAWHLHHVFLDGPTKKLLNAFSKWKSVKKILAVSNCVGEQITNKVGHDKVRVLYNPVDIEKYSRGDATKVYVNNPELNRQHSKGTIAIGHVALMQETKRQNIVIKTIAELKAKGFDAYAILAGGTKNREDELYLEGLRKLSKELACEQDIFFLGYRTDVPDILQCTDLIMIPSAFEGFPLAGLEANAAGRPVVCADQGGSMEYAQVSKAGETFLFDDPTSAADAVICCMENYQSYSQNGVRFAESCALEQYQKEITQEIFAVRSSI